MAFFGKDKKKDDQPQFENSPEGLKNAFDQAEQAWRMGQFKAALDLTIRLLENQSGFKAAGVSLTRTAFYRASSDIQVQGRPVKDSMALLERLARSEGDGLNVPRGTRLLSAAVLTGVYVLLGKKALAADASAEEVLEHIAKAREFAAISESIGDVMEGRKNNNLHRLAPAYIALYDGDNAKVSTLMEGVDQISKAGVLAMMHKELMTVATEEWLDGILAEEAAAAATTDDDSVDIDPGELSSSKVETIPATDPEAADKGGSGSALGGSLMDGLDDNQPG